MHRKFFQIVGYSKLIKTVLLLVTALTLNGCKIQGSKVSFDWENDLESSPEPEDVSLPPAPSASAESLDGSAQCTSGQECFSLLINIPSRTLIADHGMAILAMARDSENMATNLKNACRKGIQNFVDQYRNDRFHPVSQKVANKLEKIGNENTRCVFNFFDEEKNAGAEAFISNKGDQEFGLSIRLTRLGFMNTTLGATADILSFSRDSSSISVDYRDALVFGRANQILRNNSGAAELDQLSFTKNMENQFQFNLDFKTLKDRIAKIDLTKVSIPSVKAFIDQAQNALTGMSGDALAMASMGISVARDLCKDNKCTIENTSNENQLEVALDTPVPTEVNEQLRLAMVRLIEGSLRDSIEKGYRMQFQSQWDL